MKFHIKSRKKERISLSELFLKKDLQGAAAANSEPVNRTAKAPKEITRKKRPGALLTLLLLAATTTFAAFVVIKSKDAGQTARVATAKTTSIRDWEKTLDGSNGDELKGQQQEYKAPSDDRKVSHELTQHAAGQTAVVSDLPKSAAISVAAPDDGVVKIQYRVLSSAPVFKEPEEGSRIATISGKKALVPFNSLSEQNGFVYAVINNGRHRTVEGWLRKTDLTPVKVYYRGGDLK